MDIWRQICAREVTRLDSTLDLAKHAREMVNNETARAWVEPAVVKRLDEAKIAIGKKRERLKNGEFHIAVVGSEKAGKSTFINAWLENDLLPNKSNRCTFTTTKLHSTESEQKLVVKPKTREEFDAYCKQLEEDARGTGEEAKNAREDLENINKYRTQMLELIDEGGKEITFGDLEEIAADLERYAADARYAHAVKQVDLYTKSLAKMDGVLFYDVPGLNSGLSKHKQETREMLEDSDAVILVKSADKPSLDEAEKQILGFAESDSSVPLKDKVFFFCSKIDKESTHQGLMRNRELFLESCKPYEIDEANVFFGSAPATLLLAGRLKDTDYITSRDDLKQKLKLLLDLPDDSDEIIFEKAGVKPLQDRIEDYLEHDREKILKASVQKLVRQVEESASSIHNAVRAKVPDTPDEMMYQHKIDVEKEFQQWLYEFWKSLEAEVNGDESEKRIKACLSNIEESYRKNVEEKLDNLPHFQPEQQKVFFDSKKARHGSEDYEVFNSDLRVEVNKEVLSAMQEISSGLSWDLYQQLSGYIDELSAKFRDTLEVRGELLRVMGLRDSKEYQQHLDSALSALFLRPARPLARALMKHRHGLKERREEVSNFGGIFRSLSEAYPDDMPAKYANLVAYLAGRKVGDNQKAQETPPIGTGSLGRRILTGAGGIAGRGAAGPIGKAAGETAADAIADKVEDLVSGSPENRVQYSSRDDIVNELNEDREALKIYLLKTVFGGAGIGDYADQELLRIREKFVVDCEIPLKARAGAAFREGRLKDLVPPHLRDTTCDTQIAERLSQLATALKQRGLLV